MRRVGSSARGRSAVPAAAMEGPGARGGEEEEAGCWAVAGGEALEPPGEGELALLCAGELSGCAEPPQVWRRAERRGGDSAGR